MDDGKGWRRGRKEGKRVRTERERGKRELNSGMRKRRRMHGEKGREIWGTDCTQVLVDDGGRSANFVRPVVHVLLFHVLHFLSSLS